LSSFKDYIHTKRSETIFVTFYFASHSFSMLYNGFVYDTLRGLARNLANKNLIENP